MRFNKCRAILIVVLLMVLLTCISYAQSTNSVQSLAGGVKFHDLTFAKRVQGGTQFIMSPDSIWDLDIGYKNPVTAVDKEAFCQKAKTNKGLLGIDLGSGVIVVPSEISGICAHGKEIPDNLVFIDPENGKPVISWGEKYE